MKKAVNALCIGVKKYLPSPYVLALSLTLITFFAAVFFTESSVMDCIGYMSKGMYSLLSFTMQMVLVLVTGHVLANAPVVKRLLRKLAKLPRTRVQAIILVSLVGAVSSYINWGFGLVAGALVSREVARTMQGQKLHYPTLIAACYAGNLMRGPSSAIPLEIATEKSITYDLVGIVPIADTLYSSWNIIITIAILVSIPILMNLIMPLPEDSIEIDPTLFEKEDMAIAEFEAQRAAKKKEGLSFAEKLDEFVPLAWLPAAIVTVYIVSYFYKSRSLNFGLNEVILIFFALGAWAHKTPGSYSRAVGEAIKTAGGIVLQFMFYAAIMTIMKNSGLAEMLSNFFVHIATAKTLPALTLWSAGILNIFIPSGGGQWSVQGPIMMKAAQQLGADPARVAMALCWGDSWTNQIQPFWALPALAIAGLDIRDIMGYCFSFAIVAGVILTCGFLFL